MDALLQGLEVQPLARGIDDDDLAVEHAAFGKVGLQRLDDFREVARHWFAVAAANLNLVAVAEHDGAEAVPLRFVELIRRDLLDRFGEHRLDGRDHG